jgi:hypothetical protein
MGYYYLKLLKDTGYFGQNVDSTTYLTLCAEPVIGKFCYHISVHKYTCTYYNTLRPFLPIVRKQISAFTFLLALLFLPTLANLLQVREVVYHSRLFILHRLYTNIIGHYFAGFEVATR